LDSCCSFRRNHYNLGMSGQKALDFRLADVARTHHQALTTL
jgi:hypothetical protein